MHSQAPFHLPKFGTSGSEGTDAPQSMHFPCSSQIDQYVSILVSAVHISLNYVQKEWQPLVEHCFSCQLILGSSSNSPSVCLFDKLDVNVQLQFESVTWRFQKQKILSIGIYIFFKMSPQCHTLNNTYHFHFQRVNWRVVFLFTSHNTCFVLNCVCQWTCIFWGAGFCVSNVKNLQKLCQIYTLLTASQSVVMLALTKRMSTPNEHGTFHKCSSVKS